MELGPPVSLTRRLTVRTGQWPRMSSPRAGHAPMTVHRAPATVSQPYPYVWQGRGRPLPFRSYRDHAASLSARSHRTLPSHRRADRHHPSEPPPLKSLTSTGSSSSSCAAILKLSRRLHRPKVLRETSPAPVASGLHSVPPPCPRAPPRPHGAHRPPHQPPYLPSACRCQATPADRTPPWTAPSVSPRPPQLLQSGFPHSGVAPARSPTTLAAGDRQNQPAPPLPRHGSHASAWALRPGLAGPVSWAALPGRTGSQVGLSPCAQ
jgi:hypothetical protein